MPRVVVVVRGPWFADAVESRFTPEEPDYPPPVLHTFEAFAGTLRERAAAGEAVPYDSNGYRLVGFEASADGLILSFSPTTYYRAIATNARLDAPLDVGGDTRTLRERYATDVDLRVGPVPELPVFWSVGVSIVTSDGWLLVSQRGATALDPDVCGPAMAEGANRELDADATGAPDQLGVVRRGLLEELGIGLGPDELTWLSLSASADTLHYALIGRVDTPLTLREVESRAAGATDAWETKQLLAVEFSPGAVARFCADRQFSAFGLATVVNTLLHEYGEARTVATFGGEIVGVTSQCRTD